MFYFLVYSTVTSASVRNGCGLDELLF